MKHFEFVEYKSKSGSASRTILLIIRDRRTHKPYFVKMFIESVNDVYPDTYPLLKHEIDVYDRLYRELTPLNVRNVLFPHRTISGVEYEDLLSFIGKSNQSKKFIEKETLELLKDEPELIPRDLSKITYMGSISEMVDKEYEDFANFLSDKKTFWTSQSLSRYIAILVLTLYQMSTVGVNQNDLHFGNILVSRRRFGPTSFYCPRYLIVTQKHTFIIENEYTLFVFDFDRAALEGKFNSHLMGFEHGGNCPEFHEKRDLIRVICAIFQHIYLLIATHSDIFDFQQRMLNTLVLDPYIRQRIETAYDTCWLEWRPSPNERTSISCIDSWLDNGLASIPEIMHFFFKEARFKTVPTQDIIQNKPKAISKVVKELSKNFLWSSEETEKTSSLENELEEYVKANVQYTKLIPEREKFIKNIIQGFKKTIQ